MYQPYPSSGGQPPERLQAPGPVRLAAIFMYAGAALSVATLVVTIIARGAYRTAIHQRFPHYTTGQVNALASATIVLTAVTAAIETGLWLLLAWGTRGGRPWARIIGTVLFVLYTLYAAFFFSRPYASVGYILNVLIWLAGAGAVFLLWRPESSRYFRQAGS